jgi:hypothetical protein
MEDLSISTNLEVPVIQENLRDAVKLLEDDIAKNYRSWELSFQSFRSISQEAETSQRIGLIKRYSVLRRNWDTQFAGGINEDNSSIDLGLIRCRALLRHIFDIQQHLPRGVGIPIEIGELLEEKK